MPGAPSYVDLWLIIVAQHFPISMEVIQDDALSLSVAFHIGMGNKIYAKCNY